MAEKQVILRIKRQQTAKEAARWEEFALPWRPSMNVIICLRDIAENPVTRDGKKTTPITYDSNCLEEICGSCAMLINGKARMACSALIDQLEHPIRIEPNPRRVRVRFNGKTVVDTTRALTLFEATYPGVQYVPREDADMSLLARTPHKTHCPYKGDAAYYSIQTDGHAAENAVWTYEQPLEGVSQIAGYLAFYPNKVEIEIGS